MKNDCFCSIIPGHVFEHIAKNGNDEQKNSAINTLAHTERLRAMREVIAKPASPMAVAASSQHRTVYDTAHTENLPGVLKRDEGSAASSDIAINEMYDYTGVAYGMFHEVFKRNSIDNHGMRLNSTVHYGRDYDNAFWNGQQMVAGDGDAKLFNRFTIAADIIIHEMTHGVTQHTAQLVYWDEPGTINEHISDVFGMLGKARLRKLTVKTCDWIIGAGIFTSKVKGLGIRSMRDPGSAYNDPVVGKDIQPNHMSKYVKTNDDNGGVHINSGILNRAFYLACEQLDDFWKPGNIWYTTLTSHLRSRASIAEFANATAAVAGALFGVNGKEQQAIKKGWGAVGVVIAGI